MTPVLPELTRRHAERVLRELCDARVAASLHAELRLTVVVRGANVTVVEERPPWKEGIGPEWTQSPIAQFRFGLTKQRWSLHWRDRNLRWHLFEDAAPTPDIETLVRVLAEDTTGIFWG